MAWTTPVTRATGYVVLAADWNAEHVTNLLLLHGDSGTIPLISTVTAQGFLVNNPGGGGMGYFTGSGSTVTQATSRNTAVTINTPSGQIVTNGTSLASGATAIFTVNNSTVNLSDVIALSVQNNPASGPFMIPAVTALAVGSFQISYANTTGSASTATLSINFSLVKGAWA